MKNTYFTLLAIIFAVAGTSCTAQSYVVKSSNPHILYTGRVATTDSTATIHWTGTSVKMNFTGTAVKATLNDEFGENYYNVIIDGKVSRVIRLNKGKNEYTLAKGLADGKHSIELWKRTEWAMGKTWLYNFKLYNKKSLLEAPKPKKRKIEFFGNSITCGYAVEDSTGQDRGSAPYENGYISYAAITARHFNADYYSTSKSGIGITISWFPLTMPEMYDRLDPSDPQSKWDFSKYMPDVVVINLFQNDSWLVNQPNHAEFKARFGKTAPTPDYIISMYSDFIKNVRAKYPNASIICALGNMDATQQGSAWPGYIKKAVDGLNDKRIYTCFFPFKNTGGHPNPAEQQDMANDLIKFIDQNISW